MKKITIFIIILYSTVIANTNSYQGLGDSRSMQDPAMLGLGGSWYFSGQTNGISVGCSSTFWRSKLSQLSSSFSFINNKFDSYPSNNTQLLNYIHFQVPVGKNKSIAFSLTPSTRSNYYIKDEGLNDENILFNGEIINTDIIYYGQGGITDLKVSYSMAFSNNLSIGMNWDIGFGSFLKRDTLLINNIVVTDFNEYSYNNLYTDTFESRLLFKTNSFNINGLYTKNNFEFASSITFDYNLVITENKNYFSNNNFYNGTEFLSNATNNKSSDFNLREIGIGFTYKLNKKSALNIELHNNSQRLIPQEYEIFGNLKNRTTSIHMGMFKWIPTKGDFNILNTIVLRTGAYHEKSKEFYDFGLTFGVGVEYFNNTSFINLGCKLGIRNSTLIELNNELYSEIIISIMSSDKWFK